MTGTGGRNKAEDERVYNSLSYENIPKWMYQCTVKLERPVRDSIKSGDETQGAVPRQTEDDYVKAKRARSDAPTPFQMYFRYINEIRPAVQEEEIEIDVSEKFAELKFHPNRESIMHDCKSWEQLEIHKSNTFPTDKCG